MRRQGDGLGQGPVSDRPGGAPVGGLSLRYGVLLPGLALLVAAVLTIAPVAFRLVNDYLMNMAEARAGEVLSNLVSRLDERRQNKINMVKILAADPALRAALAAGDADRMRQLLRQWREAFGLDDVLVVSDRGELLVSLNEHSPVTAAAAYLPLVQRVLREGPVSEVRVLPIGLAVSAGVTCEAVGHQAVLVLSTVMGDMELAEIKAQEQVEIAAFQGGSVVAASLPVREREALAGLALSSRGGHTASGLSSSPWHLLPLHREADPLTLDGISYTASWGTVPGGRILVLVENSDLLTARDMIGRALLLATGVALALLLVFGLLVAAAVIRPLQRIIRATGAMTAGDLGRQAPATYVRELNQLAGAINIMAERIRTRLTLAEQAACTDFLTGLYNHRYFQEALAGALQTSIDAGAPCALMMIDLDRFKLYNDARGHQAGDDLLRAVAQVIGQHSRVADIACRYGGDEFAVIMPRTDALAAAEMGHRIRQSIAARHFTLSDGVAGARVTASVGIAVAPDNALTKEQMIKHADDAMYRAKNQTRQGAGDTLLDARSGRV